jgi:hypothetical protein
MWNTESSVGKDGGFIFILHTVNDSEHLESALLILIQFRILFMIILIF